MRMKKVNLWALAVFLLTLPLITPFVTGCFKKYDTYYFPHPSPKHRYYSGLHIITLNIGLGHSKLAEYARHKVHLIENSQVERSFSNDNKDFAAELQKLEKLGVILMVYEYPDPTHLMVLLREDGVEVFENFLAQIWKGETIDFEAEWQKIIAEMMKRQIAAFDASGNLPTQSDEPYTVMEIGE